MFDSHCHLNDEHLLPELEEVISNAKSAGVGSLIVIGWDLLSSKKAVEIAQSQTTAYLVEGQHLCRTQTLLTLQLFAFVGNLTGFLIGIEHMEGITRSRSAVQA